MDNDALQASNVGPPRGVVTFVLVGGKESKLSAFDGYCIYSNFRERLEIFPIPSEAVKAAVAVVAKMPTENFAGVFTAEFDPEDPQKMLEHARGIASTCQPGQVAAALITRELSRISLSEDYEFHSLGAMPIGTGSIEHLFLVSHATLPFRQDEPPIPEPVRRHNCFIGRTRELEEIRRLMDLSRIVSVVGPSGLGKSAILQRLVTEIDGDFTDGVAKLDLSPLAQPALVEPTLVRALEAPKLAGEKHLEALTTFLRPRRFLLVLDNVEHLLGEVRRIVSALTDACPELAVLIGSHRPLRLTGESPYRLEGLEVPSFAEDWRAMRDYDAIALFVDRAQFVNTRFCLTSENASDIATLCQRLDGIPLAIELAASKTKILSPKQIVGRLDECRFALLKDKEATSSRPARHRTLESTVDWGYQHLREEGRILLRRLSVFVGAFTFDQAVQVCSDARLSRDATLSSLEELLDGSMIAESSTSGTEKRFHLLETIRAYARERLRKAGEETAMKKRHREWCARFAAEANANLSGREQALWLSRLDASYEDIRSVIEWHLGTKGDGKTATKMLMDINMYFFHRLCLREGLSITTKVVNSPATQTAPLWARACNLASVFATRTAEQELARAFAVRSITTARRNKDYAVVARARNSLAFIAQDMGRLARARRHFLGSLALLREINEIGTSSRLLINVASLETTMGLIVEAREHLSEAEILLKDDPEPAIRASLHHNGAHLAIAEKMPLRVLSHTREAISLSEQIGSVSGIVIGLRNAAYAYDLLGNYETAALFIGASQSLRRNLEQRSFEYEAEAFRALTWRVTEAVGIEDYRAFLFEGAHLMIPEVLKILDDTLNAAIR